MNDQLEQRHEEQDAQFDQLLAATLREHANPQPPQGLAARIVQHAEADAQATAAAPASFWTSLRQRLQPARRGLGANLPKETTMPNPTIPNPTEPNRHITKNHAIVRASAPVPDVQFAHFGVLNSGKQSRSSILTAVATNIALVIAAIIIGAATHVQMQKQREEARLIVPIKKEPEPVKPAPKPPPKPLPKPPVLKVEPKVVLDKVKLPDPPKPVVVKMPDVKPVVPVMPAPPKQVIAAAAPKPVAVNIAHAASVPNNDPHPSAVRLGHPDSPVNSTSGPSVSPINVSRGMPGMPSSNTGGGPRATSVNMGSGQPGGTIAGTGPKAVTGVKLGGITGGTGTTAGNGIGTRAVQLGQATPPPMPKPAEVAKAAGTTPKVTYKPEPVYTPEARAMHLEGTVLVSLKVLANGSVQVLGVTSGLGHGLDEAAIRSVQQTRFQPALDAAGHPVDWQGIVKVKFQLAG